MGELKVSALVNLTLQTLQKEREHSFAARVRREGNVHRVDGGTYRGRRRGGRGA
jgi:hypothetical protein